MNQLKIVILMTLAIVVSSCTKSGSSVTPIGAAGCDVESAVTGAFAASVAQALTCSNQAAIQASFQTALGNVNLCGPQAVGQIKKADLVKKDAVKPQGIVGNVVCPIAINTIVGFASNSVPSAWGCTKSVGALSFVQLLTTICQETVPI